MSLINNSLVKTKLLLKQLAELTPTGEGLISSPISVVYELIFPNVGIPPGLLNPTLSFILKVPHSYSSVL